MCGITGFFSPTSNIKLSKDTLNSMSLTISHRGPDNYDVYYNKNIGLAHNRLSIIDLSKRANQPMHYDYLTIIFNGEIYNFHEIKSNLVNKGYTFKTTSDTEVLLKAFHCWKEKSFLLLNGVFSFAIFDSKLKQLFLCRDRLGVKPLYYSILKNSIIFSSEIKSIIKSDLIEKKIDFQAFSEYMYFVSPMGVNTMYSNIFKLRPGTYMKFDYNGGTEFKYWELKQNQIDNKLSYKEAVSKTRKLINNAVNRQLISDVPVATFLSGGIDSSAVTILASRNYSKKLNTYSVDFDFNYKNKSELPAAKMVAEIANSNHNEIRISGDNITNIIEDLAYIHDEPFADAANIPLYLLCKELDNDVKVVLQGDGGDEVFGGYNYYSYLHKIKKYRFIASSINLFTSNLNLNKFTSLRKLDRIIKITAEKKLSKKVGMLISGNLHDNDHISCLSNDIKSKLIRYNPLKELSEIEKKYSTNSLNYLQSVDLLTILPNDYLEKVDKPTMANSIESRVPLLDNELVDFVTSLPVNYRFGKGIQKKLLKSSLRGIVPDSILDAKKRGFGVPFENWLVKKLNNFTKEVLFDYHIKNANLFDYKELNRKFKMLENGQGNYAMEIWRCLNFALWYRNNF